MFTRRHRLAAAALIALAVPLGAVRAQQPAAQQQSPEVGAMAPDFTVTGATRYGLLAKPVHLSDFRGKTVVLAFFYNARTKG
jgi:cytochrome oxidase Cu insertion factor (SCO1/SenC/PrrC family)